MLKPLDEVSTALKSVPILIAIKNSPLPAPFANKPAKKAFDQSGNGQETTIDTLLESRQASAERNRGKVEEAEELAVEESVDDKENEPPLPNATFVMS